MGRLSSIGRVSTTVVGRAPVEAVAQRGPVRNVIARKILKWVPRFGVITAVLLMVLPGGVFALSPMGVPIAPQHMPAAILYHPTPQISALTGPMLSHNALLPGSDPTADTPINGALLGSQWASERLNLSQVKAQYAATHPDALASAASAASGSPLSPTKFGTPIPTGFFTGYVNATRGSGLQGVAIQSFGLAGQICPQTTCGQATTSLSGYFTAVCPAGPSYVQAALGWWLTNISFQTCAQSRSTFIGTIYLVHDAFGRGIVKADTPGHQNLSGVAITSNSRDNAISAQPEVFSNVYGVFIVPLPPVPARVDFTPPPGYFTNFTYTNATPYENISLGFVYLERQVLVTATLYDAVTRNPIPVDPFGARSLTVCASLTNSCVLQGQSTTGPNVNAFGPPGPDYVQAEATGYILDQHPIGFVPKLNPGAHFNVGPIYLIPYGVASMRVTVTVNASHPIPRWGTGLYYVSATSLDGYQWIGTKMNGFFGGINTTTSGTAIVACGAPGSVIQMALVPARVDLTIKPDTTANCGPFPMWPIPGLLPVWGNETLVNATPDMLVGGARGVPLNLTPGTYIEGNVTVQGGAPPPAFAVVIGSTYVTTIDQYSYVYISNDPTHTSPWMCSAGAHSIPDPPTSGGHTFCAPAPPEGDVIQASASGYSNNFTWAATQFFCCNTSQMPFPLGSANAERFNTINLTQGGSVYGHVYRANSTIGAQYGSYKICSAGLNPFYGCPTGGINLDGSFFNDVNKGYQGAPLGWDYVTASAAGAASDTAWVYVTKNNTIGNITLSPLGTIYGRVTNPEGQGLYSAVVQACPIYNPNACKTVGAGLTTTDGHYNGTMIGGWLPWTTYLIQASTSGYTTNWVWINVTGGTWTPVPTIVLKPIAQNATGPSEGLWLDGTLLDNRTGWGVVASSINACPSDGGPCVLVTDGSNPGGYFNQSILPGLYNLTVSAAGYYAINVFFNASNHTYLHLGVISMSPLAWVSGNVTINPWGEIHILFGSRLHIVPLGPGSNVVGCGNSGSFCGVASPVDSLGRYNTSIPYGVLETVRATGVFAGGGWSVTGGFNQNRTIFNTTGYWTPLTANITLDVFATVVGQVRDDSTHGTQHNGTDRLPVRWASVSAITTGTHNGAVSSNAGGGGDYIFLLPPGNGPNRTTVGAIVNNVFYPSTQPVHKALVPAGFAAPAKNLTLARYGWAVVQLVDSISGKGVPYNGVSATFIDRSNFTTYISSGVSNAAGFANFTAPVGPFVRFVASNILDFNFTGNITTTKFIVRVNQTSTTYINGTDALLRGNVSMYAKGWVRSSDVNYLNSPNYNTTILDKVNHRPLPFATVTVATSDTAQVGTSQSSNWGGMFLSNAPIGPKDQLVVKHGAYVGNATELSIVAGQTVTLPKVNLTGDGILAGEVIAFPSGLPVSGATITACPVGSTVCTVATTNATGLFWINAAPGVENLTVDAAGFVSNTSVVANPCSDCWDWIGTVTVNEFAYVSGIVRGLPSGLPVMGATVGICSTLGTPDGPCGFLSTTDLRGVFLVGSPSGTYILQANDTFFNSTYLPISLAPGERVNVGTLFLSQFGSLTGLVESATSFTPISNATVLACPDWSGGGCVTPHFTSVNGRFSLQGPAGPFVLTVSAPGFTDAFVPATIVSGTTTPMPVILIYPLGSGIAYPVSGTVVNASNPTQGLAGATVAAMLNGTNAFSTTTTATGNFHLNVVWGTYLLTVSSQGWHPAVLALTVHGPVAGLLVGLGPMTYNVTGVVKDGLNGALLSGVSISTGGVSVTTDSSGSYTIALTNGTNWLNASYGGANGVPYVAVPFAVTVNGAGQSRDLTMFPPSVSIYGLVADGVSGVPVSGAHVTLQGTADDGVPLTYSATSDQFGQFHVNVWEGKYTTAVASTGYTPPAPLSFTATGQGGLLTIKLSPLSTAASGSPAAGAGGLLLLVGAGAGVVVAGLLAAFLLTRPRARPGRAVVAASGTNPKRT